MIRSRISAPYSFVWVLTCYRCGDTIVTTGHMIGCHMSIGGKTVIKPTFYNLPEEKRRRITAAIISEFSETSDEKVSINRIIHRAEISRGSFYQYFDDKVDLIEVLMRSCSISLPPFRRTARTAPFCGACPAICAPTMIWCLNI